MKEEYIPFVNDLIELAIREDIGDGDHSSLACIPHDERGRMKLLVKQEGVLAGVEVAETVLRRLDSEAKFEKRLDDGARVKPGDIAFYVEGRLISLLQAERILLNIMQRMSGVATQTAVYVQELDGLKTQVIDTRKTTPNMRVFEKYAVRVGGGNNHRYNLSDGVLLKDNHIGAAGGVKQAISMAKAYAPFVRKIEVEVENLDMVKEAVEAGADIIMLDNMTTEQLKESIDYIAGRAEIEVSGNVTKENIARLTGLGVNYVSSGALTHSAPILDLSMKNLHPVE